MAVIKCKMCGGNIEISEDKSFGICEYCGSIMTLPMEHNEPRPEPGGENVIAMVKRGNMALEDGDWKRADGFFERALDMDAECAEAYLGKALAKAGVCDLEQYKDSIYHKYIPNLIKVEADVDGHTEREQRLAAENAIPGYLGAEELRVSFAFDFGYFKYDDEDYERQIDICIRNLEADRNFARAEKYATEELQAKLCAFKESLRKKMEDRLCAIRARNEQSKKDVCERYEQTFARWEQEAGKRREDASIQRDKEYQEAVELFENKKYKQAADRFLSLGLAEYRESAEYAGRCKELLAAEEKRLADERAEQEALRKKQEAQREKKNRIYKILAAGGAAAAFVILIIVSVVIIPANKYSRADALFDAEEYDEAAKVFEGLKNYKDSSERALQSCYAWAETLQESGDMAQAAIMFDKAGNYNDARQRSSELWSSIAQRDSIACGDDHTVGLRTDGTVVAVGRNSDGECEVSGWENIVAVSTGAHHTVGLRADGTVVAAGENDDGECEVSDWESIVAISAGENLTAGLKSDGTVVAVGENDDGECEVSWWNDIVAISVGYDHTVGIKSDGTVVAAGSNDHGECEVSGWENIVAVSVGEWNTIGVKSDGTVVAVGSNGDGACEVSDWENIVAVSAGSWYTIGLKSDGTAVAAGSDGLGRCEVSGWENIVAVSARDHHTAGLRSDGTVVVAGSNYYGACDASDWTNIKVQE